MKRTLCRKAWEVIQAKYTWFWIDDATGSADLLEIVLPPRIIIGAATAGALFDALWSGKSRSVYNRTTSVNRAKANLSCSLRCSDNGGNCLKLSACEPSMLPPTNLFLEVPCARHQHTLVIGDVSRADDRMKPPHEASTMSSLSSLAQLLGMGNYFIRLVLAMQVLLQNARVVVTHQPPGTCTDLK